MSIKTVVTGKNQLTIPAALARELNIEPGTEVEWEVKDNSYLVVRPVLSRTELAKQLEGMLRPYLLPGEDPIADLIRERAEEDLEEGD
ncbi:MAG: AbrB/MazE/SpoVT family DNA-binding domain-containing protein [Chloroflexota bacterium]